MRLPAAALLVLVAIASSACGTSPSSIPTSPAAFHGCPTEGRGGDPELNRLKNRTETGTPVQSSVEQILSLPWPRTIERRHLAQWPPQDRARVEAINGEYVQIEGYLIAVSSQGPEATNCQSATDVDFHIWLAASPSDGRERSVIIEATPRVRAGNPDQSLETIRGLVSRQVRVRVTGWMMLDPEHPDQVGKTRGTIWEIHPVMKIEGL